MEYVKTLEKEYLKRKQKNEKYSIRAFSNYLGIHSATLSAVLKNARHLSLKDAEEVAAKLYANDKDQAMSFMQSFFRDKASANEEKFVPDDADFFPILKDWEYAAIITLMDTKDFSSDFEWIAHRLNLTVERVGYVFNYLQKIGMIEKIAEGKYHKTHKSFCTSGDVNSLALRQAHKEELKLAASKQDEINIEDREFGSMLWAVEKSKIPQIKKKIREFTTLLERTFETEKSDEVYFFTYQLFPVTRIDENHGDQVH
jgi:uncharacterized protein (TIGR02147 family)